MMERNLWIGMGIGSVAGLGASALVASAWLSGGAAEPVSDRPVLTASGDWSLGEAQKHEQQNSDTNVAHHPSSQGSADLPGRFASTPQINLPTAALSPSKVSPFGSSPFQPLSKEQENEATAASVAEVNAMLDQIEGRLVAMIKAAEEAGPSFATALAEANRLGIIAEIEGARPSLRKQSVWRMSAALVREARRFKLDPLLLTSVARVESAYNPLATSPVGARGVLQVMSITGGELLARRGEVLSHADELYDIETSISLGAEYLARMLERFNGDLDKALVAYNRGPAGARAALRANREEVLAGYPRKVRQHYSRLSNNTARRLAALKLADEALGERSELQ